jgi:hypothetical protein
MIMNDLLEGITQERKNSEVTWHFQRQVELESYNYGLLKCIKIAHLLQFLFIVADF